MIKTKLIALLTGVTVVAGVTVAVLNTSKMSDINQKLENTQGIINDYEQNESELEKKYNSLNDDATEKITTANSLIKEKSDKIKTLNTTITKLNDQIKQLGTGNSNDKETIATLQKEIEALTSQVNSLNQEKEALELQLDELANNMKTELEKANLEIEKANQFLAETDSKINIINNSASPLTADELSKFTGKVSTDVEDQKNNSFLTGISASIQDTYAAVNFDISENINIGMLDKGNVVIKFLDSNNDVIKTKNKTWAGYLNDINGKKYCGGTLNNKEYPNQLTSGSYSTALSGETVSKIIVTVTNNNGISETLEINK